VRNAFLTIILIVIMFLQVSANAAKGEEAEGEITELGDVVVTATRTERKSIEIAGAVDTVSRERIEESKGFGLGEVLEELPGVQSGSKNGAYDSHIIIRGAGAQATYGIRQIMIMVDGIPITDPDSFTRLDPIDISLIERVEVVKGPNSTLYGANAAGGVINIITKDGFKDAGLKFKGSAGGDNTHNYNLTYGGSSDKVTYFLSGSYRSSDSWREHNEFNTGQLNAKLGYLIDDSSSLQLHLGYTETEFELPGTLTEAEFESDPSQVSSSWPNSARDSDSTRIALNYNREFSGGNMFTGRLYFQNWSHFHPVYGGINDGGANTWGAEIQNDLPHKLVGRKGVLTMGITGMWDDYESDKFQYRDFNAGTAPYTSSDVKGDLMERTDARVSNYGVYIQEEFRPADKFIINGGVRYDKVSYEVKETNYTKWGFKAFPVFGMTYIPNAVISDADKDYSHVSPRIGVTYLLTDSSSVYAAIATGFQTPTRGELVTNLGLEPAETLNYEVGYKAHYSGGHSFNVSVFHTNIDSEIIEVPNPDGSTDTYFDNAGKSTHEGVETAASIRLIDGLTLGLGYTYSDFILDEYIASGIDYSGNRLPLIPVHQYNASLKYSHSSGFSGKIGTNVWDKYHVDEANSETYKGYTVVNTRVAYEKDNMGLFVTVDNIFDEKYATEVSKSRGALSYSPAAPRTWMAGGSYKF